jgi:tight adherence protein B
VTETSRLLIVAGGLALSFAALLSALVLTRRLRLDVEHRIDLASAMPVSSGNAPAASRPAKWAAAFDGGLRRLFTFGIARTWSMTIGAPLLLAASAMAGAGAWLIGYFGLHLTALVASLPALTAALLAPRALLKREQRKVEEQFLELFPDAIDMLVRMLKAGIPLTAGIKAVAAEEQPPVNIVFNSLSDQLEIGVPLDQALASAGERIDLPDFRYFAVAVGLQQSTGGNLAGTLSILTDIMRKRRATRLKARSATSEVRTTAIILGAMPFFVIGGLLLTTPDYLAPLVFDPRGKLILAISIGLLLLGYLSMRYLVRSLVAIT